MAMFNKNSEEFLGNNKTLFEVMQLAAKDGSMIDGDNPLPVSIGGDSITITGSVTIPGSIEISNEEGNPIPTHAHFFDENDDEYTESNPFTVDGTVDLGSTTLAALENVTIDSMPSVSIDNFPASQAVTGTFWQETQPVSGPLTNTELRATPLTVSGTIYAHVNNFPASQAVTGTFWPASQTVNGSVSVSNFPATQTVDGTVGITGDVNVTQGTDPWAVSGNVNATLTGASTVGFNATQTDAFGRLRVSNPVTLFDTQNRYIDGELFSSGTSGSGGVTYNANSSGFTLAVTGNGDEVLRQAKRVTLYQPGKSLLVMNTFTFNTPVSNLRQRVGYFTAQNGIFLEADGTDVYIVKRSYTSGSAVDTRIAQSNWNGDTMDGNGSSGVTIDVSKTQILWTDIEWLGVGSVRVGFVINGQFILAHSFHHANSETDVYMTTATLNCRYEITSTGAAGSMRQICSTVISEGGYLPTPPIYTVGNGTIEKRLSSADTLYPLATIRLDPNTPDAVVIPSQIDFLSTDVRYGEVQIVEGATLTGASFNNSVSSIVETDTSATAMSGGEVLFATLFSSRSEIEFTETIKRRLQLKREVDGTPIILTLAAASTGGNTDVLYKFGWEELSN